MMYFILVNDGFFQRMKQLMKIFQSSRMIASSSYGSKKESKPRDLIWELKVGKQILKYWIELN